MGLRRTQKPFKWLAKTVSVDEELRVQRGRRVVSLILCAKCAPIDADLFANCSKVPGAKERCDTSYWTHVKRSITRMYVVTAKSIALTDTDEQRGLHSVYSGAHATDTRDNGMGSRQRLERGGSALSSMLPHAQMIR